MKKLLLAALMMLCAPSSWAIDAACTLTTNAAIYLCPSGSTDWYLSYQQLVNDLDALYRTAPSTFTVAGNNFSVGPSTGSINCVQGKCGIGSPAPTNAPLAAVSGTSNAQFAASGFQYVVTSATNTIANTNEIVLYSTAVPAGVLANVGDKLAFNCDAAGAGTATTKRLRIRFGTTTLSSIDGTILADTTAVTSNGVLLTARASVVKTGSSTQNVMDWYAQAAGTTGTAIATPTLTATDTGIINVSCTCQNGTANSGDCVGKGFSVTKYPAP